jgi:hypothetical protein
MSERLPKVVLVGCALVVGMLVSLPAFAGSAIIGSVAANVNATIGGDRILPNTTISSGDSLNVGEGVAIVSTDHGGLLTFGRQTTVSFLQEAGGVAVLMNAGSVTLRHPAASGALLIKTKDVTISPASDFQTDGEIASLGEAVLVTTHEGLLRVKAGGKEVEVGKGKTVTISIKKAQPARSPQGGGGGGSEIGKYGPLIEIFLGGTTSVLGGVAISRSDGAKDNANSAASNANAAASNAAAAASNSATAAGASNATGCAVNNLNSTLTGTPSPYTPPSGQSCP